MKLPKFTFFTDVRRIADALERMSGPPPEPVPVLPATEAVSYYSDAKTAALEEIDAAVASGNLSPESADEFREQLEKEPI